MKKYLSRHRMLIARKENKLNGHKILLSDLELPE
jgi:hypothetical protein